MKIIVGIRIEDLLDNRYGLNHRVGFARGVGSPHLFYGTRPFLREGLAFTGQQPIYLDVKFNKYLMEEIGARN